MDQTSPVTAWHTYSPPLKRRRSSNPEEIRTLQTSVVSYLIVAVVVVWYLRPDDSNVYLAIALEVVKNGLVAYFVFHTTLWLRTHYRSHRIVRFLLPLVTGSFTELVLAILLFKNENAPAVEVFLLGSAYAKPLVMGALCLIVQGIRSRPLPANTWEGMGSGNTRLLGYSGLLVAASATGAETSWISQALPAVMSIAASYISTDLLVEPSTRHDSTDNSKAWVPPVVFLILLKGFAIHSLYSLLGHVQNRAFYPDTSVYFTLLPLMAVSVDHAADFQLGVSAAWRKIITSILFNYFHTRLLATMAGHAIGPAIGQWGLGLCLIATTMWLSVLRVPLIARGLVLLFTYACIVFACVHYSDAFERFVI